MGAFKDIDIEMKALRRLLQEAETKLTCARNELTGMKIKMAKLQNSSADKVSVAAADAQIDWN